MTAALRGRRGIALLSVLLALLFLEALAAASLLLLVEERREADGARFGAAAEGAAETGAAAAVENWTGRGALGGGLFLVSATGQGADSAVPWGGTRARVGLLVRVDSAGVPAAALVSAGDVSLAGDALVEADTMAGEQVGVPVVRDTGVGTAGNALFARLLGDTGMAVRYLAGGGHLGGEGGTGVLLVDGSLEIDSGFHFRGVVLVRGALVVSGSGTDITQLHGTVITLDHADVGSGVLIKYDKQLVDSILRRELRPQLIASRPWIQLF